MSASCKSPEGTLAEFMETNSFPGNLLLCGSCGTPAFFNNPTVLDSCCDRCKGIDDFNSVRFNNGETIVTTFSNSTTSICFSTPEEIEFVGTLKNYFERSIYSSNPEMRVEVLNTLKALHYKSVFEAFKKANPESMMTIEEFRKMLEKR
jgi:hypothetical protein